jgi:tetratricopeptide (TPR) repeat protein
MKKDGESSVLILEIETPLKNLEDLENKLNISLPRVLLILGNLYLKTKQYELSEHAMKRALHEMESMNEKEYPSSIHDLGMLGLLYRESGKYKQAADAFQQELIWKETKYGKIHLQTIDTVLKLAELYGEMEKWTESQDLHDRAMTGFKELLGDKGMDTNLKCLCAMWKFGMALCDKGDIEKGKYWYHEGSSGLPTGGTR